MHSIQSIAGFLTLALLLPFTGEAREGLPLAESEIIVADEAPPAERYAAEELQRFIRDATGVEPPIATRPLKRRNRLFVGDSPAFRKSRLAFDTAGYGDEELGFRCDGRDLAIVGGRPRGVLYGVYQFLEDCAGVRFLTAEHTHVPYDPGLRVPPRSLRYSPPFRYRWNYYRESMDYPEFAARLRLNTLTPEPRLGGVTSETQEAHSLHVQVPAARYGAEHPEYFAWVEGRRILEAPGGGPQVCSTNPDVVDIVAEAVLRELAEHPERTTVSVTPNDNVLYCRCAACAAVNDREETPGAAHLTLVNAVAERVARVRPDAKVLTLAYGFTMKPPRYLRPRDNVQVMVCPFDACGLHRFDDTECLRNADFLRHFNGWRAIAHDPRFWLYNTNLRYLDLPYPNLHSLGPNLRLLRDWGVRGVFAQGNGRCTAGEMADLRNYLTARLLWNPDLDEEALSQEFLRLHYGPAAPFIEAYLDMISLQAKRAGAHPHCWSLPEDAGLDTQTARRIHDLFRQAREAAKGTAFLPQVEKAALCAYKPLFETAGHLVFENNRVRLAYPEDVHELIPEYRSLAERYGLTLNSERETLDTYLSALKSMLAGTPAVRLENTVWRVTVLTDFNGETVELLYKPTGRQLLPAWERPGVNLPSGTLWEWGAEGYDHTSPMAFDAQHQGDRLVLTKRLPGGATFRRVLGFSPTNPEFLSCETILDHAGSPTSYRFGTSMDWALPTDRIIPTPLTSLQAFSPTLYHPDTLTIGYLIGHITAPKPAEHPDLYRTALNLSTPRLTLNHAARFRTGFLLHYSP